MTALIIRHRNDSRIDEYFRRSSRNMFLLLLLLSVSSRCSLLNGSSVAADRHSHRGGPHTGYLTSLLDFKLAAATPVTYDLIGSLIRNLWLCLSLCASRRSGLSMVCLRTSSDQPPGPMRQSTLLSGTKFVAEASNFSLISHSLSGGRKFIELLSGTCIHCYDVKILCCVDFSTVLNLIGSGQRNT